MIQKIILPILALGIAMLVALVLMANAPSLDPNIPEPMPTVVRVTTVTPESVNLTVISQGSVNPNVETQLIPEVSGQVIWMSPALVAGGRFTQGEVLLRLDDQDLSSVLERAAASLSRAEAEHQHADFEYQRLESLGDRQLASRSQIENALRTFRIAQASLQEASAMHDQAQRDLSRTEIQAPFSGLVRNKKVDIGQFVARGNPIATIYATDIVEVRLPIADQQLAYLQLPIDMQGLLPPGSRPNVQLTANYAGRSLTWSGEIIRTEAEIDTKSRMVHVVARIDNRDQNTPLSVGLFVNGEIMGRTADNIIQLPRSALRGNDRVLIVDQDNRLRFRTVELLRLFQDKVLISAGLTKGDRVCLSPIQTVIDGMPGEPIGA